MHSKSVKTQAYFTDNSIERQIVLALVIQISIYGGKVSQIEWVVTECKC